MLLEVRVLVTFGVWQGEVWQSFWGSWSGCSICKTLLVCTFKCTFLFEYYTTKNVKNIKDTLKSYKGHCIYGSCQYLAIKAWATWPLKQNIPIDNILQGYYKEQMKYMKVSQKSISINHGWLCNRLQTAELSVWMMWWQNEWYIAHFQLLSIVFIQRMIISSSVIKRVLFLWVCVTWHDCQVVIKWNKIKYAFSWCQRMPVLFWALCHSERIIITFNMSVLRLYLKTIFFFLLVPQEPPEVEQVVVSLGNIKFHICKKKKKSKMMN